MSENIDIFEERIRKNLDIVDSMSDATDFRVHKKALYVALIDSIGAALYPKLGKSDHPKLFESTVIEYGNWSYARYYSLPHVQKYLERNNIPVFRDLKNKISKEISLWKAYPERSKSLDYIDTTDPNDQYILSLKNDITGRDIDFILNKSQQITCKQKKKIKSFRHVALLRSYRNSLLHTFLPRGMLQRDEKCDIPYYDRYTIREDQDLNKVYDFFDLVYPIRFFSNLTRCVLANAISYFKREGADSLRRLGKSEIFWDDALNVDLSLGHVLLDLRKK
jgi:hypothetical protein